MPKALEETLKRRAAEHGFRKGSPRYKRYVYGSLAIIEERKRAHDAKSEASEVMRRHDG